jgi:hypothetical protein
MTRAYGDEAMKPLAPRLEPPRPWCFKWLLLAIFAASVAIVPALKGLLG